MAIEVRIPTILRTYTDGAKAVPGSGATLADLLVDLEVRHPGVRARLVEENGELRGCIGTLDARESLAGWDQPGQKKRSRDSLPHS